MLLKLLVKKGHFFQIDGGNPNLNSNIQCKLNEKCIFGKPEIKFLGMLFTSEGLKPETEKVRDLENIISPKDKDELGSFICMIQSNGDFIPSFAKVVVPLQKLLKVEGFCWTNMHQKTFQGLLKMSSVNCFHLNLMWGYLLTYLQMLIKLDLLLFYAKEKILKT